MKNWKLWSSQYFCFWVFLLSFYSFCLDQSWACHCFCCLALFHFFENVKGKLKNNFVWQTVLMAQYGLLSMKLDEDSKIKWKLESKLFSGMDIVFVFPFSWCVFSFFTQYLIEIIEIYTRQKRDNVSCLIFQIVKQKLLKFNVIQHKFVCWEFITLVL